MDVLDEQGRLFGLVNVVDLFVVLFVLGVAGASVALVIGGTNQGTTGPSDVEPEPQRYATLSFPAPIESEVADLRPGDVLSTNGGDSPEVVDVHRTFSAGGWAHLTVRVTYRGNFTVPNGVVYGGDDVDLTSDRYRVQATVLAVNQTSETIPTRTVPVVLEINRSSLVERYVRAGQEIRLGGQTVATVRSVTEPDNSPDGRLLVGVDLRTWTRRGTPMFGGRAVRVGTPVTLVTDEALIRGHVVELDTVETTPE